MPSLSPLHRPHSTGHSRGPCLQRGGGHSGSLSPPRWQCYSCSNSYSLGSNTRPAAR